MPHKLDSAATQKQDSASSSGKGRSVDKHQKKPCAGLKAATSRSGKKKEARPNKPPKETGQKKKDGSDKKKDPSKKEHADKKKEHKGGKEKKTRDKSVTIKEAKSKASAERRHKSKATTSRTVSHRRGADKKKAAAYSHGGGQSELTTEEFPSSPQPKKYAQSFYDSTIKEGRLAELIMEFDQLPRELPAKKKIDEFTKNRAKNRYTDVLCLDDTRVMLQKGAPDDADYIHASFVNVGRKKRFILTQGPTPNTVIDFWRMVYQHQAGIILMLCRFVEEGRNKCYQYYPTEADQSMTHGPYTIKATKALSTKKISNMVGIVLEVSKDGDDKPLIIEHHQWESWPDQGVPDDRAMALTMLSALRRFGDKRRAAVVHCSAGIGRSGCLAMIEMCLTHLEDDESVLDVVQKLKLLREQRMHSVQTSVQFVFILATLIDFCTNSGWVTKNDADHATFIELCERRMAL